MFKMTDNYIITMTRGDSANFGFYINLGSTLYPDFYNLKEGDKVYFGITEPHKPFELGIVMKVISLETIESGDPTDYVEINLKPEDTEYLLPGTYYYSLKLATVEGDVYTFMDKKKFTLVD